MTVYRKKELPRGPARGHLIVARSVLERTLGQLRRFSGSDGRHEGIVFWAGRTVTADTLVLAAITPEAKHTWASVAADERAVGSAARAARARRLGIVAQVHSHPGDDVRHSDGDDDLVLMPFEGMFSLVVANYGEGRIEAGSGLGVHQFQDGRWTWIETAQDAVVLVDEEIAPC